MASPVTDFKDLNPQEQTMDRKRRPSSDAEAEEDTEAHGNAEAGKRRRVQDKPHNDVDEGRDEQAEPPIPSVPWMFVNRGDYFAPMIAVDELDASVLVVGLRCRYTIQDVGQLGAQICNNHATNTWLVRFRSEGEIDKHEAIRDASSQVVPSRRAVDERIHAATGQSTNGSSATATATKFHAQPTTTQYKLQAPSAARNTTQRYNPTTPGVLGQKVFCTHWMRTGECDFTQQGCMFLHRMPDLDTLEKLGFRSYPRWFREMPRAYQFDNANDFDENGLNQQRVQMREMSTYAHPQMSPPRQSSPPLAARNVNLYADGRRADNMPLNGFYKFSASNPPPFGGHASSTQSAPQNGAHSSRIVHRRTQSGTKNRASGRKTSGDNVSGADSAYGDRSFMSRDDSPIVTTDLSGYEPLVPTQKKHELPAKPVVNINAALPRSLQDPHSIPFVHKKRFTTGDNTVSNTASHMFRPPAFVAPDRQVLDHLTRTHTKEDGKRSRPTETTKPSTHEPSRNSAIAMEDGEVLELSNMY